jgi:hypothetical protein
MEGSQEETKDVQYREVVGIPGYRVGDDGSVWSCRRHRPIKGKRGGSLSYLSLPWKKLKPSPRRDGRLCVGIPREFQNTGATVKSVHRLVLEAFIGLAPDGCECCHNNGNASDNRLSNLRWDTKTSNSADAFRHGTAIRGEKSKLCKLTELSVASMRNEYATGLFAQRQLSEKYGVSVMVVNRIVNRKKWKHVK